MLVRIFCTYMISVFATLFRIILIVIGVLIFSGKNILAAPILSSCEKEMIRAVSLEDILYKEELKKFLDLRSSQADMKAKSVPIYLQNYECHLNFICAAVANPSQTTFGGGLSLCSETTAQELFSQYTVDFSSCAASTQQEREGRMALCEQFIKAKGVESFSVASELVYDQSAIENQSFLAGKIQDLRNKMSELLEKTKLFASHFNKVMSDVQCTIPDKSGF